MFEGEEEISDVSVELPVPAYIPDAYIPESKDKINAYQRLSSADSLEYLKEIRDDLVTEYGRIPAELNNLFLIIELKIFAKKAGLLNIKAETIPMSKEREIVLYMSKRVKPANIISLLEYNPKWIISGSRLRVNISDLGEKWFEGLRKSLDVLSRKATHGKR